VTCVDLNTADQTALETLDGVGPALAGRILSYRDQVGSIASADQLDEVPGIGPTLVQRIAAGACP
jgi:competence protein ComEA